MDEMNQIGKALKQARIDRGFTLEDVQQLTKIQKRYLISIEENRTDQLPDDFFVKTLIQQYADVLDMDISDSLNGSSNYSENDVKNIQIDSEQLPSRVQMKKESKRKRFAYYDNHPNNLPTFLMILFIILITGIIWYYFYYSKESPTISTSTTGIADQSQQVSSSKDSSINDADLGTTKKAEISVKESTDYEVDYILQNIKLPTELTVEIDSSGRSWINITFDDEVAFEGTLEAGMTQTIDVPKDIEILSMRIGYLPSTTIKFGEDLFVPKPENNEIIQTQNFTFEFE